MLLLFEWDYSEMGLVVADWMVVTNRDLVEWITERMEENECDLLGIKGWNEWKV